MALNIKVCLFILDGMLGMLMARQISGMKPWGKTSLENDMSKPKE